MYSWYWCSRGKIREG